MLASKAKVYVEDIEQQHQLFSDSIARNAMLAPCNTGDPRRSYTRNSGSWKCVDYFGKTHKALEISGQVQLTTEQAVHLFSALGIKGLDSRFDFEGLISFSFVTMERNVIKKDGLLVLRPDVDVLVYVAGHGHCEWGGQEWVRLATLLDIAVLFITFPGSGRARPRAGMANPFGLLNGVIIPHVLQHAQERGLVRSGSKVLLYSEGTGALAAVMARPLLRKAGFSVPALMALNPVVDIFKYISSVAALQLRSRPGSEPAAPEERLRHQAAALASLASAVLQRLQELLQGVDVASISSVSAVQQGPVEEDGTRYLIGYHHDSDVFRPQTLHLHSYLAGRDVGYVTMAGPGPTFTMMVPDLLANRATDTPDWRHSATNVIFSVSAGQEVCLAHQQWAGRVSYFSGLYEAAPVIVRVYSPQQEKCVGKVWCTQMWTSNEEACKVVVNAPAIGQSTSLAAALRERSTRVAKAVSSFVVDTIAGARSIVAPKVKHG